MNPAIKRHLEAVIAAVDPPPNFKWRCIEHLVRICGQDFAPGRRPSKYPKGEQNFCFSNSAKLALLHDELLYVEGFAVVKGTEYPVHHAWNCKIGSGKGIDVTTNLFAAYRGVPFRREYLVKRLGKGTLGMSLLDNWREEFPLFQMTQDELFKNVFATPA